MPNVAAISSVLLRPHQVHWAWPRIGESDARQDDETGASQRQGPHGTERVAYCGQCEYGRDGPTINGPSHEIWPPERH